MASTIASKQVNVSVTILSISGLHVKDTAVKKKSGVLRGISPSRAFPSRSLSPARRKKGNLDVDTQSCTPSTTSSSNNNITDNSNETTVVASFTRMAKKKKKRMAHVGSIPLKLSSDNYDCDADIQWPTIDASMQQKEDSSHYRFLHTFDQHEESNDPSLPSRVPIQQQMDEQEVPQTIQIAISRQGRMFKLGTASIPLSTDTRSGSSDYTLPITNCNPIKNKKNGVNKPMMMKLKDDTIKVSMDTDATIKIRVAVSPSIGETVTISERFNVTMITDSMIKQKEMQDMKMKEEQMRAMREMSLQKDVIAAEKKEQPTLEDVSTTTTAPSSPGSTAQIIDDDTLSHPEDEQDDPQEDTEETQDVEDNEEEEEDDDEACCSSSAYMSVPSKYQGHNLSVTRSNSTTTTDMSSVVSDLTEGCSFLSQNGIEVVPFNTTPDDAKLSSNPNINTMLIDSKQDVQDRQPNLNATQSRAESEDIHSMDPSVPVLKSSSFPHLAAAINSSTKRQTWRERFSCVGLNSALLMCGDNDGNDISETLSAVVEEDVVSTNKYSLANLGRCHNPLSIPSASYYTDDGSFVEDDGDSDDDDESSSSSESSGGRDERYTALEGALFG